jgi:Tfp pilus assembly protein PilF
MREIRFRPRFIMLAAVFAGLAGCAAIQGGEEDAPEEAPAALADVPAVPSATLLEEAESAYSAGRLADAEAAYRDLLARAPGNKAAALGLGDTLYQLDDLQAANTRYQSVLTGGGSKAQVAHAQLGIGLIQRRREQPDAARSSLEAAVQGDPSLWKGWLALGQMHQEAGRTALAQTAYSNAERAGSNVAAVHNDIGMWHLARKEPGEAISSFERALKLDGTLELARGNLRLAHAMERDYGSALAGAGGPELPEILNNVGYIALVNGDLDTAQQLLEQAVDNSPYYNASAVANLALLRDIRAKGAPIVQ